MCSRIVRSLTGSRSADELHVLDQQQQGVHFTSERRKKEKQQKNVRKIKEKYHLTNWKLKCVYSRN